MSILHRTHSFVHFLRLVVIVLILLIATGCGLAADRSSTEAPVEQSDIVGVEPAEPAAEAEEPAAEAVAGGDVFAVERTERAAEAETSVEAAPVDAPEAREKMAAATTATPAPPAFYLEEGAKAGEVAESSMVLAEADAADEASSPMLEAEGRTAEAELIAPRQVEPLRAGEVDDNAQWDDYLLYRHNYAGPRIHDRDISERYVIEVQDGQGNPILGATVTVYLGQQEIFSGRTYANGQVLFHPLALDISTEQADRFSVEVEKGDLREQFSLIRFEAQTSTSFSERWTVTLDWRRRYDNLNLDVLFLIDATGSMADEIDKIQSTIFDVAAQIDALPGRPDTRYGMVTYRDRGDSFVSQTFEFSPDVSEFHHILSTVYADGGGDYPESLNEGLHHAIHTVEWRGEDTVQLIFLVADAPPHLDYAQDYDYAEEMVIAAQRGIKIFPIASSGLDDQGEYIFRQLAQYTQGRFIFLTYEGPTNGGAPGDVTTHHVEDYSVENLDNLLVKLVQGELAHQSPQVARGQ